MNLYTSRDGKRLFVALCCLCTIFIIIIQLCLWLTVGKFNPVVFIASLAFSVGVLTCWRQYFMKQQRMLDEAIAQLDRFAGGDTSARVESDAEGSFAKLFHTVNQMTTMLSSGAEQEQQKKVFLRNTIADISHQIKTPLAALEIYNSLLRDEKSDPEAVAMFSSKSEKEIERIETLIQSLLKITKKPDAAYLEELLTVLGLQERRNHLPRQLSGGQQQRVAIGRALITRPMLILADEPTGNLDSQNSSEVISLLKTASKRYQQTILMITHNRSIASTADRVFQVSDGVLRDLGGYAE